MRCSQKGLLTIIGACSCLYAQFDTGQITGYVTDASQGRIAGASVTVVNQGNGAKRTVTTNGSGFYVIPNLQVSSYTVTGEMSGFRRTVESNIVLDSAAKLNIDLILTVGAVTESVEVKGSGTEVQTETAQVGCVVDSKQIQDLTLNGRNPIYLALLKPGVAGGSIGTFDPDSVSNGGFSINGSRSDEYVVTVDGAVATRTRSSGSVLGARRMSIRFRKFKSSRRITTRNMGAPPVDRSGS